MNKGSHLNSSPVKETTMGMKINVRGDQDTWRIWNQHAVYTRANKMRFYHGSPWIYVST